MIKKLIIVALFLLGFFARIYRFGQVPLSLYWDEVAIGLDARSIITTGRDINDQHWWQPIFYSYGDYKAPVYIWLTAVFGQITGNVSEAVVRLPSLLAGLALGWLIFRLTKLISTDKFLPTLVFFSFWLMPWSIHFSRIGMESHLSLFWLTLAVYWLVLGAKNKKSWLIAPASLALSLGILSYISLRVIGPAIFTLSLWLFYRKTLLQIIPQLLVATVIILSSWLWLTHDPLYLPSEQYRQSGNNLLTSTHYIEQAIANSRGAEIIDKVFNNRRWYFLSDYLKNYSTFFSPDFLFISGDANLRHHSGFGGQMPYLQFILISVSLFSLRHLSASGKILIVGWLIVSPLIASLVNEVPHASRAIYLIVPLAVLSGLGAKFILSKPKLVPVVIFVLLANFLGYTHDYFKHYPDRSALAWIKPYKQLALQYANIRPLAPVYINPTLYKPELYLAFYLDDLKLLKANDHFYYNLPAVCPEGAICVDQF